VATLKYLALNILSQLKFLFIRNVKFKKCLWYVIHQSEQLDLIYQLPFPLFGPFPSFEFVNDIFDRLLLRDDDPVISSIASSCLKWRLSWPSTKPGVEVAAW